MLSINSMYQLAVETVRSGSAVVPQITLNVSVAKFCRSA
jgi:hypothetical protein